MFLFDLSSKLYNKLTNKQPINVNSNLNANLVSNLNANPFSNNSDNFIKKHNLTINLDIINATNKSLKLYEEVNNKIRLQNHMKKLIDPEKALEEEYNDQLCKKQYKKNGMILFGFCGFFVFLASFGLLRKSYI
jgi:hypothetical protein